VESFGWKYPRLSLAHTRICARDKTQYRRCINLYSPGIKLITGAYPIYSPGVKITLEGVAPAHLIPGAYEIYSPMVSQLFLAHTGYMRRGEIFLWVFPAVVGPPANIAGEFIFYAPAITAYHRRIVGYAPGVILPLANQFVVRRR
jgi:hypothetical protein